MNKVFSTFLLSASTLAGAPAWAQFQFVGCTVGEVVLVGPQNAHVQVGCDINPRPACAVAAPYFAFDQSTPEGKTYLAFVLSAKAMGARLTGMVDQTPNSCPSWQSNVARLLHLRML